MTQADPMGRKHRNIATGAGSVGIEKGTRYLRHFCPVMPSEPDSHADAREKYCAPSADVILYPDTVERAAVAELMRSEAESKVKEAKAGLRERIREARHRSSDTYTLYGVDTCELFTAEYEIDISQGAEPQTFREALPEKHSQAHGKAQKHSSFGSMKQSITNSMRKFAYKLNRLRIN